MTLNDYKSIVVSTVPILHQSEAVNYGKPIILDYYVVRCLHCNLECSTWNLIDGEEKYGTIQDPIMCLWSARCKNCLKEWFF